MPHQLGTLLDGNSLRNFKPSHYTVLVVDDAKSHRYAIRKVLETEGYQVHDVDSGQACLDLLEAEIPHLILLDMNMPEMDGEQTCIKIREDENFQTVPILFLSSEVGPEVRIKALDAGANDFISKSCDNHEILARVRNQIQVASLFNALEQSRENSQSLLHVLHHDLNNYLSSINGYFTLLRMNLDQQHLTTDVQSSLDDMAECIKFTNIYLREIGEYQSVAEGTIPVELENISVKSAFEEVKKVFHERLEKKSLTLDLEQIDEKSTVLADRRWFGLSVLNNLISNAIKFSYPEGVIAVECYTQGRVTKILVKDQGIGIPQQLLRMINAGNKSFTRKGTMGEKGTGFGLKLVRNWMELFSGTIEVESLSEEEGGQLHGTRIELTLPCCK